VIAELYLFSMFQHSAGQTERTGVNGADEFTPLDSAALREVDGAETCC
jgi:hypothetical protein